MAFNFSKQVQTILTQSLTNVATNMMTDIANSNSAIMNGGQTMNFKFVGLKCTNINILQSSNMQLTSMQTAITEVSSDVSQKMMQDLITKIKAAVAQENAGYPLGNVNNSIQDSTAITQIVTNLQANVATAIATIQSTLVTSTQTLTLEMEDVVCENLDITQDLILITAATQAANTIAKSQVAQDYINKIATDLDAAASQKNTGLDFNLIIILIAILVLAGGSLFKFGIAYLAHIAIIAGFIILLVGLFSGSLIADGIGASIMVFGIVWWYVSNRAKMSETAPTTAFDLDKLRRKIKMSFGLSS